jgi:hypothetical protein
VPRPPRPAGAVGEQAKEEQRPFARNGTVIAAAMTVHLMPGIPAVITASPWSGPVAIRLAVGASPSPTSRVSAGSPPAAPRHMQNPANPASFTQAGRRGSRTGRP